MNFRRCPARIRFNLHFAFVMCVLPPFALCRWTVTQPQDHVEMLFWAFVGVDRGFSVLINIRHSSVWILRSSCVLSLLVSYFRDVCVDVEEAAGSGRVVICGI